MAVGFGLKDVTGGPGSSRGGVEVEMVAVDNSWEIMSWGKVKEWEIIPEQVFLSKWEKFMPNFQDSNNLFTVFFGGGASGTATFGLIINKSTYEPALET